MGDYVRLPESWAEFGSIIWTYVELTGSIFNIALVVIIFRYHTRFRGDFFKLVVVNSTMNSIFLLNNIPYHATVYASDDVTDDSLFYFKMINKHINMTLFIITLAFCINRLNAVLSNGLKSRIWWILILPGTLVPLVNVWIEAEFRDAFELILISSTILISFILTVSTFILTKKSQLGESILEAKKHLFVFTVVLVAYFSLIVMLQAIVFFADHSGAFKENCFIVWLRDYLPYASELLEIPYPIVLAYCWEPLGDIVFLRKIRVAPISEDA